MTNKIESVAVFCGASNNVAKHYIDAARDVGNKLAENNIKLIYGGGDCGLMGASANGCLDKGGYVIGVFPTILQGMELEHHGLSEHYVVGTMHARKQLMFDKSDAFIILPGGFGTMDETFEVITWRQLHMHQKPIIFYNYNGYWNKWKEMTEMFLAEGFASAKTRSMYDFADSLEELLAKLK
jgi:uncharacterized protein (TIGR00730 family)